MSAKELEEFIKVIETAETLSNRPESSIWSYPTDIFSRPSQRKFDVTATPPSNAPHVPKLWEPKSSRYVLNAYLLYSVSSLLSSPTIFTRLTFRYVHIFKISRI